MCLCVECNFDKKAVFLSKLLTIVVRTKILYQLQNSEFSVGRSFVLTEAYELPWY